MDTNPHLTPLGHGLYCLDSGYFRPNFDAVHLVVEAGRVAVIDTGTLHTVPRVLDALRTLGLPPASVDWVVLTHVHLDHAGGAGALLAHLPQARIAVHPSGAPHLIDPSRLWAGTVAVYGEEAAERAYGRLSPIEAGRIQESTDGMVLKLGGRPLICLDAPGHARHHIVIHDPASARVFAGDTFGISYRELDVAGQAFVFPSSTPVQFDPADLRRTVQRILDLRPEAVCLTHWSEVTEVPRLGAMLLRRIDDYEALGLSVEAAHGPAEAREAVLAQGMETLLLKEARAHGCALSDEAILTLLDMDIRLNAAGLVSWLDRRARPRRD